ncbi:MAG: hypothetical protein ACN4GZ_18880 [Acidimicrobiales bacterium]
MNTPTFALIFLLINVVLVVLFFVAYRLFKSDPTPTVSDPLGVPRVARVSGVLGTMSENDNAQGVRPAVVTAAGPPLEASSGPVREAAADRGTVPDFEVTTTKRDRQPDLLELPGLFALDTGSPVRSRL